MAGENIVVAAVERFLREGVFLDMYEPQTTLAARRIVKPGMVCVDVGANIGWYTVLFDRLCAPHGQVYAIEPLLGKDIDELQPFCPTLKGVLKYGLDSEEGRRLVAKDSRAWTLVPATTAGRIVEFVMLDTLVATLQIPKIDVIKIDVDGGEVGVILGGLRTLHLHHPTLILEIAPDFTRLLGQESLTALRLLTGLKYTFHHEETDALLTAEQIVNGVPSWSSWNIICR